MTIFTIIYKLFVTHTYVHLVMKTELVQLSVEKLL